MTTWTLQEMLDICLTAYFIVQSDTKITVLQFLVLFKKIADPEHIVAMEHLFSEPNGGCFHANNNTFFFHQNIIYGLFIKTNLSNVVFVNANNVILALKAYQSCLQSIDPNVIAYAQKKYQTICSLKEEAQILQSQLAHLTFAVTQKDHVHFLKTKFRDKHIKTLKRVINTNKRAYKKSKKK